jgi:hypothetical protein
MKLFLSSVVWLALLPWPTFAQMKNPILGAGNETCGAWLSHRNSDVNYLEQEWLLGYISATVVWMEDITNKDIMYGSDANGAFYWIDNYCRQNPTD